ncbi:MAG: class I SAM-dependent rRNA methyltransferase [Planctomycetaceae bacterium]
MSPHRPTVVVKPRRALPFFSRHPWVFSGAIARVDGEPEPGSEVDLVSHEGRFIGRGLYNPDSNIKVRLYTWDSEISLDHAFWARQLDLAIAMREQVFGELGSRSARRLVFSEADGLSGLVVDRYGDWLLMQMTSRALAQRQEELVDLLQKRLKPRGIWLRTEKGVLENESLTLTDGLVYGDEPPRPLFIEEYGVRYGVDVVQGQKTGHFLDQCENRKAVSGYVQGHRVLDAFCYSGGFSLAALVHGQATHVMAVDSSEAALRTAAANAELNEVSSRLQLEQGDVFHTLERLVAEEQQFNTVVIDPPKMARHRRGVSQALKGYQRLNRSALALLPQGGILVTCTCSGLVDSTAFEAMLAAVAVNSNRRLQVLESRRAAADHPVATNCPENDYLRCYICRVV